MGTIGTVILAAGESSRLGRPKQLLVFRGKSLLRRTIDAANEAGCSPIVVVLGCEVADRPPASQTAETAVGPDSGGRLSSKREQADRVKGPIERELLGLPIVIVKNENWRAGIGTSIRAGVQSLIDNNEAVAAMILLVCDQPFVDAHTIEQLTAIREKTNKPIVATSYSGTVGVPALFDRSYFDELLTLPDDSGAKPIILRDEAGVATFSFPAGNIDIDTWTDYEKLSGRHFQPL